jgi:8-oxo-dGTP pyrophosphatase MutT (NUDIX family)
MHFDANLPAPVVPRLAAAVALLRPGAEEGVEVFMVRRHVRSEFVPDVYVFPGGSVQPGDQEAEATAGLCAPVGEGPLPLGAGVRAAALRELFEEAGALLAYRRDEWWMADGASRERFAAYRADLIAGGSTLGHIAAREGLRLATDALAYWAHWITPVGMPKRFDTHFFLAEDQSGQLATHDNVEVTASAWITPEAALEGYEQGRFPLVFATVRQLRELAGLRTPDEAFARFAGVVPPAIMPIASRSEDGTILVRIPGDPEGDTPLR